MDEIPSNRLKPGDVDLAKTVLKAPMPKDALIASLRSALDLLYPVSERYAVPPAGKGIKPLRIRYNDSSDSLKLFDQFLLEKTPDGIAIDEALMGEFRGYLSLKLPHRGKNSLKVVCGRVRSLVNALPEKLRHRKLLSPADHRRVSKYDCFTDGTKRIILQFLANGRILRKRRFGAGKPTLSSSLLAPSTRRCRVDQLGYFLKVVGKNDVFSVDADDADKYVAHYADHDIRQTGINNLADLQAFFINLVASGSMEKCPFVEYYYKINGVDDDFVLPDALAILFDISRIDLKDLTAVRNRLLAICLCYDYALRIGEVARLKVQDVKITDFIELTIRKEIQKGDKPTVGFFNYFPESKTLMTAYLKLRAQKHPATDALIITEKGKPMRENGCRDAVQDLCRSLGVITAKGKVPAPHRFRHSLGTCNAQSIGLKLSMFDIMDRLRHTSVELTRRIYITNNPLLTRAKHEAHLKANGIRMVRGGDNRNSQVAVTMDCPAQSPMQDFSIPENNAVRILFPLGITLLALRKYAEEHKLVERANGGYVYDRHFVEDLSKNFYTKKKAMQLLGITSRTGLYFWINRVGISPVVIGKASLLKKEIVLQEIEGRRLDLVS